MTKDRLEFTSSQKREIASWSNWHCMECGLPVSKKGLPEIAHIIPAKPQGPRSKYFNEYDKTFIQSIDNGVLLCPNCHTRIDNDEDNYPPEYLFEINKYYQEKERLNNYLNIELFSIPKKDDFLKVIEKLKEYLEIDENDINEEIKSLYSVNVLEKIDVKEKMKKNRFNNETKRGINAFVQFEGMIYYSAMSLINEEIGNVYLLSTIKVLYKKLHYLPSEQEKYNEMLKIMKEVFNDLNINETSLLNYFFQICEVFIK